MTTPYPKLLHTAVLSAAVLLAACEADRVTSPEPGGPALGKQGTSSSKMLIGFNGQVWIMNDDGSERIQLTSVGINDQPAWAPGGKRVLFAAFAAAAPGIYSMNSDGSAVTRLTIPPLGASDGQPSALGKRVAFGRTLADGTRRILAVNADGTNLVSLTPGPHDAEYDGSSRGDKLAFASASGQGGHDIYLLDVASGGITQLTHSPTLYKAGVAFSPGGKQIAFTRTDLGQLEGIFVMSIDGTQVTRLSRDGQYDFLPRWSPDGKRIGFTSARPGAGSVYTMLATGGDIREVAENPALGAFLWAWATN
jgi:Tol biopolymer transport system component